MLHRFRWPTPIEWAILAGGLYLVIHYAWLMDDAYVYFRYADNLLFLKRGLVFNAGEYVEGFSSPLWMMLLIPLRATGLNYWLMTRIVGVLTFGAFWLLLVILNRRLSPPTRPIVNVPLCYLALNYGVLCYFTSGLETPLIQVSAVLYALFVLNPGSLVLQLLLALTPLLRHELAVPFAMCLVWAWVRRRKFPWGMTFAGVLITGAWEVFRVYYYADLFPNTFYLKDTSAYAQGLVYLQDTAGPYWLYPLLAGFVVLGLVCALVDWRRGRARDEETPLPSREGSGEGLDCGRDDPHPALPLEGGGDEAGASSVGGASDDGGAGGGDRVLRCEDRRRSSALPLPGVSVLPVRLCRGGARRAGVGAIPGARTPGDRGGGGGGDRRGIADALPNATECSPVLWERDLHHHQQD